MSKSHPHGAASAHSSKVIGAECAKEKIEMLTPKQNGYVEEGGQPKEEGESKLRHTASIKGMWKSAFKSLKSKDGKQTWLSKKSSLKKKDGEQDEESQDAANVDPVYSLLKCAADLPRVEKAQKDGSSGSTSKASSPSSSGGRLCMREMSEGKG